MSFNIPAFQNPSVMAHSFSQVPHADIPRSAFRRSHGYKTTFDSGFLIPIYADEALPGDTFKLNLASVARMATPLVPLMDNMYMDFFFFAVPNRLVWDNFQRFMGEKVSPTDTEEFLVPQIELGPAESVAAGSIGDYFGIPTGVNGLKFNSLHFRAYNLIFNEWFRDQNLCDPAWFGKGDGPDPLTNFGLKRRCKRHDYFTSCLPWPQKGTAVDLPLGTRAPVLPQTTEHNILSSHVVKLRKTADNTVAAEGTLGIGPLGMTRSDNAQGANVVSVTPSNLWADLTSATAATINDLREAFQMQKLMERDARGGTRYTEIVRSHFRVESPDARLQRPEFLGGGSKRIIVDPVPSTNDSNGNLGYLGACAYVNQAGTGFTKSFVEHCLIIGLVNVRADLSYQQGLNRMWSRQTKYDYYWPALAHLGEQAVLSKEIYADGSVDDDDVFGYQERWAEYRYHPSLITGQLRSNFATSLDLWHLSQDFAARPELNADFIFENPPVQRVTAVADPEFIFDGFFDVTCTRPMPTYSVPGLIDHF